MIITNEKLNYSIEAGQLCRISIDCPYLKFDDFTHISVCEFENKHMQHTTSVFEKKPL